MLLHACCCCCCCYTRLPAHAAHLLCHPSIHLHPTVHPHSCACFDRSGKKISDPWTEEMEQQAVAYYCTHYIDAFSQTDVSTALACIPQLNMWDGARLGFPALTGSCISK